MDKLIVSGLGGIDGEYECDLAAMISIGNPETLTNAEGHRIKLMTGIRVGEIDDSLGAGDSDILVALAAVVLTRHSKRFDDETLWNAPIGSGLEWEIGKQEVEDDSPPSLTPPEGQELPSGGVSSSPSSAPQENDQSPTGTLHSETPTSDLASPPALSAV